MRKRTTRIGIAALVGLWLVPAIFVAFYDPSVPRTPGPTALLGPVESALGLRGPEFFMFSHGYTKQWSITTWAGPDEATADKTVESYHVERGPLDRLTGTFRFFLRSSQNHARDLEGAQLLVTSDDGWGDGAGTTWTKVADANVERSGADVVALTCEATVPASTTAYRLEETRGGKSGHVFSKSMLTAPTFMGRVYDKIAWLPIFRWVPQFR